MPGRPLPPAGGWWSGWGRAAVAALATAGLLGWCTSGRPGISFVDFVGFADRARQLGDPLAWMHPLYPVGYPALLAAGRAILGDVVLAGEVLGVLSGALLAGVVARSLGLGAALWILGSGTVLASGVLEGTDLPATALSVTALLLAARAREAPDPAVAWRCSLLAGGVAGAACLVRYTALPVPLLVLLAAPRRWAALAGVGVGIAPHVVGAWIAGASPLPDQRGNLAIAVGHHASPWALDTLRRWPGGFARALGLAAGGPAGILGVAGLAVGLITRDRRAALLAGLAVLHLAGLGLLFSNPRLVLPAHVAVLLGVAFLPAGLAALLALAPATARLAQPTARGGAVLLGIAGVILAVRAAPEARAPTPEAVAVAAIAREAGRLEGPFVSNSPWFHARRDGWVEAAASLRSIAPDARGLGPADLAVVMERTGMRCVALEAGRTARDQPGLVPLHGRQPPGFRRVLRARSWVVLEPGVP